MESLRKREMLFATASSASAQDQAVLLGSHLNDNDHGISGKSKAYPADIHQMLIAVEGRKARVYPNGYDYLNQWDGFRWQRAAPAVRSITALYRLTGHQQCPVAIVIATFSH